jgi:hypothetical protein
MAKKDKMKLVLVFRKKFSVQSSNHIKKKKKKKKIVEMRHEISRFVGFFIVVVTASYTIRFSDAKCATI